MKFPRSCRHHELGPCPRCAADFLVREEYLRHLAVRGLRVSAAQSVKLSIADWVALDRIFSVAIGKSSHVSETYNDPQRTWEPVPREELPRE